jgi:hypothetical protein
MNIVDVRVEHWIDLLNDEDIAFMKRFVLASGSLKDTARAYGISYPTVRLRLDRLIAKVRMLDETTTAGLFERTLRAEHSDGRLDTTTLRRLLQAYRRDREDER